MKLNFLSLYSLLFLSVFSCKGQDRPTTILPPKNDEIKSSITDNFSKIKNLYFDSEEKLIFSSSLINNLGKVVVYYIPISKESIRYYQNFEKNNNITPLYDEVNSLSYFSLADQKKIDKILKEKIKSEKDFKVVGAIISKEFINIESNEEYNIKFPYSQKYYQKENGKWTYLFEKKIVSTDEDAVYNSKNYLVSLTAHKKGKDPIAQYSAKGTWRTDCKQWAGSLSIYGKDASFTVLYNQIYIDMIELKRYDFEKGIAYALKEIPDDMGNIGRGLNWKEYVNDEPIAYIKMIDDKTIYFYWYGFYNKKTKKREFKETNFNQETDEKEIVLKKCDH